MITTTTTTATMTGTEGDDAIGALVLGLGRSEGRSASVYGLSSILPHTTSVSNLTGAEQPSTTVNIHMLCTSHHEVSPELTSPCPGALAYDRQLHFQLVHPIRYRLQSNLGAGLFSFDDPPSARPRDRLLDKRVQLLHPLDPLKPLFALFPPFLPTTSGPVAHVGWHGVHPAC